MRAFALLAVDRRLPRRCAMAVLVVALAGCGAAHARPAGHGATLRLTPKLARTLDATLRSQVSQAGVPGASAAIVFPDGREWSLALGAAQLKPRVAMTTRTSFPFDSVSKMATAALALRLAEDGRLALDDPVAHWYPTWRGDPAATVRDLLGHTSGAGDITGARFDRLQFSQRRLSVGEGLRTLPRPGPRTTEAAYSNAGFEIAGIILARAAREPLGQAMRRRVLSAPGGDGLVFQPAERPHPPLAHGYDYPHGLGDPVDANDNSGWLPRRAFVQFTAGAGGLAGDVPSLARWDHALLGGHLLRPHSLQAMVRFHPTPAGYWLGYGLGVARDSIDGHLMWGHSGDGGGDHTELWYLPRQRLTVAISWNDGATGSESLILRTIVRAALGYRK